jgi:tetratricopeptide (TPR) repeat protein
MSAKVVGVVAPSPALLRACRQLLKYWDRPRRLADNALVRTLADRGIDVDSRDAMQHCLVQGCERVAGRHGLILRRCDVLHEGHGDVYAALGLSRRQFYRERTLAIENLTRVLLDRPQPVAVTAPVTNRLALALAHAHALEQVGRWLEAVDVLEGLVQSGDRVARIPALCRLVELHVRAGRPSLAGSYLALARSVDPTPTPLEAAFADVAEAGLNLAFSTGSETEAACRRAVPVLRQHAGSVVDVGVFEALAAALLIEGQIALEQGYFSGFVGSAREAHDVLAQDRRPNRVVAHDVDATLAYSRLFDGSGAQYAEAELWRCYRAAVDQALLRQTAIVACSLARVSTRAGFPDRSLAIVGDVLPTARSAGWREPLTLLCLEASDAAYCAGDRAEAHRFVLEARTTVDDGRLRNHVDLAAAHLELANGCFREALALAESAEAGLARMKRTRYAASALRVQAEALAGLGERRRALRTALVAAEMLEHCGTPFAQRRIRELIGTLAPHARAPRLGT